MDRAPRRSAMVEPIAEVSEETFSSDGTSDIITCNLPIGTKLYVIPEGSVVAPREVLERALQDCMFLPLEETVRRNIERNAAVRELRALLAQQGQEVGS